ncbi:MAG: integrase family protein [Gammaproteobacteria bacterium]|jgi:integrase|nr:integrase family protein [Gammaproteobacteria bacterium]MBT4606930.1 integrase family protein [Thiotrichales bacterium]MBT4330531.1 integrase family protein [Gammaproteobacteria bacterium]MBT4811623.1 integrase family protein [Thiotrichales bacterium]MBT5360886.1 integrase family protein [Gammaproteobacteria bacterium]
MEKNELNFTQSKIKSIKPPLPKAGGKETRVTYHDKGQTKLSLRVSSSGAKTYYVSKKDRSGKLKNVRIGKSVEWTVDEARVKAAEILTEINRGADPNEEKRKARARSLTLQESLDDYIKDHELKPVTERDYRQKMKWGFSDWLGKPASDITDNMVLARHKKLTKKGKTATNGAFRPLRAVLNYAITTKAISHNPVAVLSAGRLWHKERRRNDLIESGQLKEWIDAVNTISPEMHRTAFLMMLYMGFRITETYAIKWDDVDLENELLVQRDTKNGTDHELPIPTLLVPEIEELMLLTGGSCYMFPAVRRDTFHGRPKRQIKQINDAVSFDFNPHMTRHTFTTIAEAVGISKTMIDRLTNHTTTNDVTGGYIHTEIETLRDAINKITAYIQAKTTDSGKVVQLYG